MVATDQSKKRKIEDECRGFNAEWTEKYFFIDLNGKPVCLICRETMSVFKEHNLKRHHATKHASFACNLSSLELKKKASDLLQNLKRQQNAFKKVMSIQRDVTMASFIVAYKIAKQNKAFSDGEFLKECLIDVINVVCPEVISKIKGIPLSRRTIVRRMDEIAENIKGSLFDKIKDFEWYSIALDESADATDTAQLIIYVKGIDDNFEITEELLSLESLKNTTTGKDFFNSVITTLNSSGLSLDKLAGITTDGAPSLTGKHSGLIKLIRDKIKEDFPFHKMMSFHCIIHQQSLCKSSLKFKHVMDPVISVVNSIRSKGLMHRQFQNFLEEVESDFIDVVYYTNVRWLSMGRVLSRVWSLQTEIVVFMDTTETCCDFVDKMKNREWVCDFAFAVDILEILNELNLKLQGKGLFAHELYMELKSFQIKLQLFSNQLKNQNFSHFPKLKTLNVLCSLSKKYSCQLELLKEEFSRRFVDFKSMEDEFNLLRSPFTFDIETAPEELQLELIDLQEDPSLRALHENTSLIKFYSSLNKEKFHNLRKFAIKLFVLFGSTYLCEQTFSVMKINKSKNRTMITDSNLQSVLRISTSGLHPDFDKLIIEHSQLHKSH